MPNETSRRKLGKLKIDTRAGVWTLAAEPHVIMKAKRVFEKIDKGQFGAVTIKDQPEVCHDLDWFLQRYDLEMDDFTLGYLRSQSRSYVRNLAEMEKVLAPDYQARTFPMALPARDYQRVGAELYLKQGFLLLGDDIGVGKTITTIATFTDRRTLPAAVVCHPFLQRQWANEIARFLPSAFVHIIERGENYPLPIRDGRPPDILIITYHKLAAWAGFLAGFIRSINYDECQELRRTESYKYQAAEALSKTVRFSLGLSATPILNYGGEMFNIMNIIRPGCLGDKEEFIREWCEGSAGKMIISEPRAFGTYLRENFLMLRRTREECGRQLPEVQIIPHAIDADPNAIKAVERGAGELARLILSSSVRGMEKMNAEQQLSNMLRQATGIAKAPYVAQFVQMLVETGEKLVLFGWHRAFYGIIEEHFVHHKIPYVMFTGTESPQQKEAAKQRFVSGDAAVFIMSNRSGAGVDGLQGACKTVVIGELDYSPGIHQQGIGRVHRDGQADSVVAYYLVSTEGSDPVLSEILGLKKTQSDGIRSPTKEIVETLQIDGNHVRRLAEMFLARKV